jgi:hypothetical protein
VSITVTFFFFVLLIIVTSTGYHDIDTKARVQMRMHRRSWGDDLGSDFNHHDDDGQA